MLAFSDDPGVSPMKTLLAVLALVVLAGCGIETATTAATSAEIKRREMEQAKNTMEQAKQKIEQSAQQMTDRASQSAEKMKD